MVGTCEICTVDLFGLGLGVTRYKEYCKSIYIKVYEGVCRFGNEKSLSSCTNIRGFKVWELFLSILKCISL